MTLANLLLALGIPAGIVIGIILVLAYPKPVGHVLRFLAFIGPRIRQKSLKNELEGSVNSFTSTFNSEFESPLLPTCKIEWVDDKNVQSVLRAGNAIVKLSFAKDDRDLNFYNTAQAFIQTAFLPNAKPFLNKPTATAIDFLMTKILLIAQQRQALRIFNARFSEQDTMAKEVFHKLEETEDRGLFRYLFLQELQYFGERLGSKSPHKKFSDEADRFLTWFYDLATREERELTKLSFVSENLNIGVILVADTEKFRQHGVKPYFRRAQQYATAGCHAIYVLSRGSFHVDISDNLVSALVNTGCFKRLTKKTRMIKPDARNAIPIACVCLKPDVFLIESNAWLSIERDVAEMGCVLAVVEIVDATSVRVDVYGLKVDLSPPSLSVLKLTDARRFFFVDQNLQLKVVRSDRAAGVLELSNVDTETDPKRFVDEIEQIGTMVRIGKVAHVAQREGHEFGLIIAFEHRSNRMECYVPRINATFSRFVSLSERYGMGARVEFTIERFDLDRGSYIAKIAGLNDPWDTVESQYSVGQRVSCIVRQVTERHLTCEVVEGVEGTIFIEELSWGSFEEKASLLKSQNVGDKMVAAIVDVRPDWKQLILSVKRVVESEIEKYFDGNKDQVVSGAVGLVAAYYAEISITKGVHGILRMRETFWSKDLRNFLRRGQSLDLKVLRYDFRSNKIEFSVKGIQCSGFQVIATSFNVGDGVIAEVLFCNDDRVTVLVMFDTYRAHGYVHRSEISNLIYFDAQSLRLIFKTGTYWQCTIKRFDPKNEIIELSRKTFLRENKARLNHADCYPIQILRRISRGRSEVHGYGDQLEGVVIDDDGSTARLNQADALIAAVRDHVELSIQDVT